MTMQKEERLEYESQEYPLLSRPLEECLDPVVHAKVLSMVHDPRMYNSSLHRNYRGCWVVRDGSLWLEDLIVLDEDRLAAIDPAHPKRGIASLFPDATGPIPATWVTGELVSGTGDTATHSYYHEWSEHLVLTFRVGKLLRSERRSNEKAFEECRVEDDRLRRFLDSL